MSGGVVVFLGPTLAVEQAARRLPATYLPPAQQGDVLRALRRHAPRAIAIVDGFFDVVPSVWHKEILVALSEGVEVFGASSMGALRAAELHRFGMIGVGEIFEWYHSGALEDDDEVAVVHGPAEDGYRELSEAMVNVRDVVRAARAAGAVDEAFAERALAAAKQLFYAERSYARLGQELRRSGTPEGELGSFAAFVSARGPSLKARDAMRLLDRLAQPIASTSAAREWQLSRTVFIEALIEEVDGSAAPVGAPSERERLLGQLALAELRRRGTAPSPADVRAASDAFRARQGLASAAATFAWLERRGISHREFSRWMSEEAAIRSLLDA